MLSTNNLFQTNIRQNKFLKFLILLDILNLASQIGKVYFKQKIKKKKKKLKYRE